jgi:hypothetical protein
MLSSGGSEKVKHSVLRTVTGWPLPPLLDDWEFQVMAPPRTELRPRIPLLRDGCTGREFPNENNCTGLAVLYAVLEKLTGRSRPPKSQTQARECHPLDIALRPCGPGIRSKKPLIAVWEGLTKGSIVPTGCYVWVCGNPLERLGGRTIRSDTKKRISADVHPNTRNETTTGTVQPAIPLANLTK